MRQKLALACSLMHSPEVLLLDEPTTGVDPVTRREFWRLLADLVAEGLTLVVATPYLDEAERCSRVVLMHEGRVLADAPPRDDPGAARRARSSRSTAEPRTVVAAALAGLAGVARRPAVRRALPRPRPAVATGAGERDPGGARARRGRRRRRCG